LRLAERWNAMLYVDDAHGAGVLGSSGGGVIDHFKVDSDRLIYMATLSKAYGTIGGFIVANGLVTEALRMCSAAYGFTATLPPDQAMVISTAIDIVADEPERRQRLWDNQRYFVMRMADLNYKLVSTDTPIVPIWLGDEAKAEQLARAVRGEGIHVEAIRFPGVPMKSARLRIQLNAGHRREDIDRLFEVLKRHQNLAEPARIFVAATTGSAPAQHVGRKHTAVIGPTPGVFKSRVDDHDPTRDRPVSATPTRSDAASATAGTRRSKESKLDADVEFAP
jgi:glycine C-acetyltransferase